MGGGSVQTGVLEWGSRCCRSRSSGAWTERNLPPSSFSPGTTQSLSSIISADQSQSSIISADQSRSSNRSATNKKITITNHHFFINPRQSLTAILDTGGLLWSKRLEFPPRSLLSFSSMMYDKRIISLISSDSGSLMFYDNTTLKWASQLQHKPIW